MDFFYTRRLASGFREKKKWARSSCLYISAGVLCVVCCVRVERMTRHEIESVFGVKKMGFNIPFWYLYANTENSVLCSPHKERERNREERRERDFLENILWPLLICILYIS